MKKVNRSLILIMSLLLIGIMLVSSCTKPDAEDSALQFDPTDTTKTDVATLNVTLDGAALEVTKYTVTYVANPIEMALLDGAAVADPYSFQKMSIYVPAAAADDQDTAIIMAVENSGWQAHPLATSIVDGGGYVSDSDTDRVGAALKAGYIFIDVGTRGRGLTAADGTYPGKAPAVVVDAKAAIRYLRLNDAVIPGSSERIVITGTSGGGGLSTAVAASGNSADYYPYMEAIGAAGIDDSGNSTINDDVFATIAYCPITDLGHGDIAYEWQYGDLRAEGDTLGGPAGFLPWEFPTLTAEMKATSDLLKTQYPAYLESLGLKIEDGTPLTAATMPAAILALAKASVEKALAAGVDVPDLGEDFTGMNNGPIPTGDFENTWVDINDAGDAVDSIDYDAYLQFVMDVSPLKGAPAFDVSGTYGLSAADWGESNLFGSDSVVYSNFTAWAWNNNSAELDGSGTDDTGLVWSQYFPGSEIEEQIKLINPIAYLIDADEGDSAPYWYVRYGLRDRDTSFAVETTLFYAIENDATVINADYGLAYIQGHNGDYDVQEAYAWLADKLVLP